MYLHRNKTTGKVFYVGKGKCRRAWECANRSAFWSKTVRKYGHTIEIVLDNLQEWYAFELEAELILKYGRRNNNTGCLVNLTNGGEGESGKVYTEEQRKRMSDSQKGELSHSFDHTVYKYYNVFSGETLECLRSEFESKTGCQHSRTRYSHYNGWADPKHCTTEFIERITSKHSGKYSPHISSVLRNFVNLETLQCTPMTVSEFIQLTGKNPSNLLDKNLSNIRTLAGYTTKELIDKFTIEKIQAGNRSIDVHSFTNIITGLSHVGTVEQLSCVLELPQEWLTRLIRNNSVSTCGWRLTSCTNKIPPYLIVSEFIHKDGRYFKGVRLAFKKKYDLDPAQLFRASNKAGTYKGWSLVK